jgi:flagellar FliL protein
MAANRTDAAKGDADKGDKRPEGGAGADAAPAAKAGGMQAWLPLIIAITVLPVVSYAVTTFVLLPKLQKGLGLAPAAAAAPAAGGHGAPADAHGAPKEAADAGGHGAPKADSGGHGAKPEGGGGSGGREQVPLTKLIVNVAGTQASRILLSSVILVSASPGFRDRVKEFEPQLRDTACGILSTKTIQDLEKPGARNIIRSELLTSFNHVLGGSSVQEIYFTDFAIQ